MPKKESYMNIMKEDFKNLSIHLNKESIYSIEVFMNLIFEDLSELIKNANYFSTKEETKEFESKVDDIIIKTIENYNEKKEEYIKDNYDFIEKEEKDNDNNYLKIKGLVPISELNENDKLFNLTKFHFEEKKYYFENYILKIGLDECQKKYPLICQVLFYKKEVKNLKYLPEINDLCNYLINKFSHRISRKEANKKPINDINFGIDKNILKNFLKSWNNLKYTELSESSPLINFLIDQKDFAKFNEINKAYKSFINQQNNFLSPIIENNQNKNDILHFYIDSLQKRISIQNSKNNQIDLSELDLDSIIIKNSKRNIFNEENDNIDYINYNSFVYDLDSIEKELGEKILPGKCLFEENILKHFTFWAEGNKEILTMFAKRYNQEKLNENEKEKLMNFVKKNYLGGFSMKEFYDSFMILFFYLTEDKNELNLEKNLDNLLKIIPLDLNLSEDFNSFLKNEGRIFKLNKILEIFLYLEHLFFELNYNNNEYNFIKGEINSIDIIKNSIETFKLKDEFIKALRRFITRYLLGDKNILIDLKDENLINEFYRSDLWGIKEMKEFDKIKILLKIRLKDINIKINQALSLYENIGQNDRENIKDFIKEIQKNKEDNESGSEDEGLD